MHQMCPVCKRKLQLNPRNVRVVRRHRTGWMNDICPMSGQGWPDWINEGI